MTFTDAFKRIMLNFYGSQLDNGTMKFYTSGNALVATLTFGADAFADISSGTIITAANTIIADTNVAGGTISYGKLFTQAGVEIAQFTVGTSGAEANFTNPVFGAGDAMDVKKVNNVPQCTFTM